MGCGGCSLSTAMWYIPLFYCVSCLGANYFGMYVFVYWLCGGCLLMCL
ncbi:unnamed protein product [Staurois parvus]|uniref:NADH dehydrogenase subunit 1 n=1 Tax=Staurois parvus TaxID=386267 RepID=A0ABN9AFH3_9NEOB|nr:unnamed protein product [Staurois parvus]